MSLFVELAKKNKEANPASWDALYEALIESKIRQKYTANQEFAILRQRDTKPEEFEAYNAYVEECKAEAKSELEIV